MDTKSPIPPSAAADKALQYHITYIPPTFLKSLQPPPLIASYRPILPHYTLVSFLTASIVFNSMAGLTRANSAVPACGCLTLNRPSFSLMTNLLSILSVVTRSNDVSSLPTLFSFLSTM